MESESPKEKYIREQKEFRDFLKDNPEIIETCKYYKGEEECPNGVRCDYWGLEKSVVIYCKEINNPLVFIDTVIVIFESRGLVW